MASSALLIVFTFRPSPPLPIPIPAARQYMAETFGLRETYTGFEERKKTAKPEFILIGTPPGSHFEICLQALKAGVHDFCEKPFMPTHRVRPVGSRSYIGCFATYVAHIITTGTGGTPFTRGLMTTRGARRIGSGGE